MHTLCVLLRGIVYKLYANFQPPVYSRVQLCVQTELAEGSMFMALLAGLIKNLLEHGRDGFVPDLQK